MKLGTVSMVAKKIRLDSTLQYDYLVIGIASQLNDYRLGYNLNQFLDIDLIRLEDLPSFFEKEKKIHNFPLYIDKNSENFKVCFLIGCMNQGIRLFPQLKYYDYLFLYETPSPDWPEDRIINTIRDINNVQLAGKLISAEIKVINPVLVDLEMHLQELAQTNKKYF